MTLGINIYESSKNTNTCIDFAGLLSLLTIWINVTAKEAAAATAGDPVTTLPATASAVGAGTRATTHAPFEGKCEWWTNFYYG